jgi:hypothetical protein
MGRERELAHGQCRVCGSEVIADERGRMDREWTQARTFYRPCGRHGTYDTAPGPRAPGIYACTESRAGTRPSETRQANDPAADVEPTS